MVNAGRVLIIPKGTWSNLQNYEMLDLVSLDGVAYLARAASVGQNPSTDTSMTYWQPFGTASEIATTSKPGLVMPDGQTITIDATGLIQANLGISDLNNVTITSIANGQILVYDSTAGAWKNANLSVSAGDVNYSNQTSGLSATKVQGAIDEVSSQMQTLETALTNKADTSTVNTLINKAYQTDDSTESTIDDDDYIPFYDSSAGIKKKILVSNLNLDNESKADKSDLTSISITGSTNTTGSTITQGTFFYKSGILVRAILDIANGATLTDGTNYETVTIGALNELNKDLVIKETFTNVSFNSSALDITSYIPSGCVPIGVAISSGPSAYVPTIWFNTSNLHWLVSFRVWSDWTLLASGTASGTVLCVRV